MKPKTPTEHKIVALSNGLPAITKQQHDVAFAKCFTGYAVQSRNTIYCLECGNEWKITGSEKPKNVTCKNCSGKLQIANNYKNGIKETDYYQVITTAQDFQVVRMICITKYMKKKSESYYFAHEVMQIFIDQNGKSRFMSKNVMGLSQYYDQWIISSELTLKPDTRCIRFNLVPGFVHPVRKVIPNLKRNGFKGKFHGIAPQLFFKSILTDSIAETLLKGNQFDLLNYHIRNTPLKTDGIYWSALKICIRNNYTIKDAKLWVDYIDLLDYYGKDIKSPKFVCPPDLLKSHDRLMRRKLNETLKETLEQRKKQIGRNQKEYFKAKKHFFGLVFSEKNISINVIETIREFLEEGCIHHHCVFTNEYYKKKDSLILSAKVNGVHMETIQLSLENFEVLQSRGRGNKASQYNKQIIRLINKNVHQIGARMKTAC